MARRPFFALPSSRRLAEVQENKGPHIGVAVRVLDDIMRRMASHQVKKRAMLRELHLAHLR